MRELKEMLYRELDGVAKSGNMTRDTLDTVGKIVDAIKDIDTIYAMDGYSYEHEREKNGRHDDMVGKLEGLMNDATDSEREELKEELSRLMRRY